SNPSVEIKHCPIGAASPETCIANDNIHQFIGQMAIDLEKRPSADPVGSRFGHISKVVSAADGDSLLIARYVYFRSSRREKYHAGNFCQCGAKAGGEWFCGVGN